ncbi:MAG: hypothetical protein LBL07_08615 [Tannerella sp.]|nr:hypothetical protein [Tannerella sp.]
MKRGSRLDELFTLLFMLLFIGVVVSFFVTEKGNPTYLILGGVAVLLRVAQYIMRFF